MARGADGSLGPIRGALKKRLQSVDELNQDAGHELALFRPSLECERHTESPKELFPQCFFDEFDPLLDSADMCLEMHGIAIHLFVSLCFQCASRLCVLRCPEDWCTMASCIERHYYDFDGFVVARC